MAITRLPSSIYLADDSGDARRLAVIGWIRIELGRVSDASAHWLRFRSALAADPYLDIPTDSPLHAVDLAAGRGRPVRGVPRPPGTSAKDPYRHVVRRALEAIGSMPATGVGSAHRAGAPGVPFGDVKLGLYEAWVRHLNDLHAAAGSRAFIVFDGNGTESGLRRAHRRLVGRRHVIGDPVLVPAPRNPLLQAADQVAYAAFQQLALQPRREFMHTWLAEGVPHAAGPLAL
ncbi:hypothetical protein ACM614_11785 [Streptomyces sp. 12297]|uniref:hypothetical protein n=1 Tax=Streptomyces sp. NBC_00239 TaxID=2903640 RepID=UPI002E27F58C|nr:hypothetical protein [Streptomyces sp. NBC_00239]